ncbi:uncharacterized protein EDB91DRAFT_1122007 [Suillus paluster]|uniref:uncharacterized protein n=1 Tax=Suillus paluster TaxID=48578 RepID=UPI001B8848AF|nr:uncharacterized protein EDB91DRAFT_1122007 [Suillus paluster]KAG1744989.1 hypothetical protein EDB91DRAFT_1122007 [Suillus paluster]
MKFTYPRVLGDLVIPLAVSGGSADTNANGSLTGQFLHKRHRLRFQRSPTGNMVYPRWVSPFPEATQVLLYIAPIGTASMTLVRMVVHI